MMMMMMMKTSKSVAILNARDYAYAVTAASLIFQGQDAQLAQAIPAKAKITRPTPPPLSLLNGK